MEKIDNNIIAFLAELNARMYGMVVVEYEGDQTSFIKFSLHLTNIWVRHEPMWNPSDKLQELIEEKTEKYFPGMKMGHNNTGCIFWLAKVNAY